MKRFGFLVPALLAAGGCVELGAWLKDKAPPEPAPPLVAPSRPRALVHPDQVTERNAREVLEAAFAEVPVLRHHLTLPTGELRPHILCLVNGESLPRAEAPGRALADGDEVEIHQAISGG